MTEKNFFRIFNKIYDDVGSSLNISQKEELYRLIFSDVYDATDTPMENDGLRKITSAQTTILVRVMKHIHTDKGFETLRKSIEEKIIDHISDQNEIAEEIIEICVNSKNVPDVIKTKLKTAMADLSSNFKISRFFAAMIVVSNYADYVEGQIAKEKRVQFLDVSFMRLEEDRAIPKYPDFITESMDSIASEFLGRESDIDRLYKDIVLDNKKTMISAVGGLGKTELTKMFLHKIRNMEVDELGIEQIAWISYDNNDLCMSVKQALHLECDAEEVWEELQYIANEKRERLLLVIDNIEVAEEDPYLNKLGELPCRLLVTSRIRSVAGIRNVLLLEPLSMEECRELFYKFYQFEERDNVLLNDIIDLTARLTIMIVFIAKAAYLEGLSLKELYDNLVEKGFKLSEEDVSCEHEKMQNDDTIIAQMCILFSLVKYGEDDKQILTCISIIPNLQFDFSKAKGWFGIKKNAHLMKLYGMGMLEHVTDNKKHIYWMHSVIAAAVREQQKEKLYDLSRPFISILTEELNPYSMQGRAYEKAYLIPFSWSAADIMEDHWCQEEDTDFLRFLAQLCYDCSNYRLCEKITDMIIDIQKNRGNFDEVDLALSYQIKADVCLQMLRLSEADKWITLAEEVLLKYDVTDESRYVTETQRANYYSLMGDYEKAREKYLSILDVQKSFNNYNYDENVAFIYGELGEVYTQIGDFDNAISVFRNAIELYKKDEEDTRLIKVYEKLVAVESELINIGYGTTFFDEAYKLIHKVMDFREQHQGQNHSDTAVAYQTYGTLLYYVGGINDSYEEPKKYIRMATDIFDRLYGVGNPDSMSCMNTMALIYYEEGQYDKFSEMYDELIKSAEYGGIDSRVSMIDYSLNYANCLYDLNRFDESKEQLERIISSFETVDHAENRKLAETYQIYGNILVIEENYTEALDYFSNALETALEDAYLVPCILDKVARCYFYLGDYNSATDKFKKLIGLLVSYQAYDAETKFELCETLADMLKPDTEEKVACRDMLLEKISDNPLWMEYIETFFTKIAEN